MTKQDASSGADKASGFHRIMRVATDALASSAPTGNEKAVAPATVTGACVATPSAAAEVNVVDAAFTATHASHVAPDELPLQEDSEANSPKKPTDATCLRTPNEPKRQRSDDADSPDGVMPASIVDASAPAIASMTVMLQMPQLPFVNLPTTLPAETPSLSLPTVGTFSCKAGFDAARGDVKPDHRDDLPAEAATPKEAPGVIAPDSAVKDAKHTGRTAHGDAGYDANVNKVTPQVVSVPDESVSVTQQSATFRSSFLNLSEPKTAFAGHVTYTAQITTEPIAAAVNEGPVKHLEVSLKDASLGDISVRAEMKDGMLHASVFTGHADSFLTASALHGFLEGNQVSIHTVHVEATGSHGVQKTMSTSTFASGSFDSDDRGERNQQARPRSMPSGGATKPRPSEHNDRGVKPMKSAQVQHGDGRSLSIHI